MKYLTESQNIVSEVMFVHSSYIKSIKIFLRSSQATHVFIQKSIPDCLIVNKPNFL
jgi:hypothetical protein